MVSTSRRRRSAGPEHLTEPDVPVTEVRVALLTEGARASLRLRAHDVLALWSGAASGARVGRLCPRCGSAEHGRPVLPRGHASLSYAESYAGGAALVAWCATTPVGVDLASRTSGDAGALGPLEDWARTEALLKATGQGVASPGALDGPLPRLWSAALALPGTLVGHVALAVEPGACVTVVSTT
ncbi:MAG: hypothetical protein CMH83_12225 [Nocardioides sp.]|nr:hypothetical protein [Nocardioides sp.]